jgi:hypothetical protein
VSFNSYTLKEWKKIGLVYIAQRRPTMPIHHDEVTAERKVVDKSEPKGIVAMQKAMRQPIESPQIIKEEVTAKRKERRKRLHLHYVSEMCIFTRHLTFLNSFPNPIKCSYAYRTFLERISKE